MHLKGACLTQRGSASGGSGPRGQNVIHEQDPPPTHVVRVGLKSPGQVGQASPPGQARLGRSAADTGERKGAVGRLEDAGNVASEQGRGVEAPPSQAGGVRGHGHDHLEAAPGNESKTAAVQPGQELSGRHCPTEALTEGACQVGLTPIFKAVDRMAKTSSIHAEAPGKTQG